MLWYYLMLWLAMGGAAISMQRNRLVRGYFGVLYFSSSVFVLAMLVGLRSSSPDYDSYSEWFSYVSANHLVAGDWIKDPAFVLVSAATSSLGLTFVSVSIIFAFAALLSQFTFSILTIDKRLSTLLFFLVFCRTFAGSDMAAIRSAVAIPLMSISIILAFRGKKRLAIAIYCISIAFHLSAVIGIVPLLLAVCGVKFRSRGWILSVIAFAIIARFGLSQMLGLLSQTSRVAVYLDVMMVQNGPPTAYLAYIAARILLMAFILAFLWNKTSPEDRMVLFCFSVGISLQVLFIFNNALSWRSSDVFGLLDLCVLMIPFKWVTEGTRLAYTGVLVALGMLFFYSGLSILGPYRWVLA